jgi:putative flippase GtrA
MALSAPALYSRIRPMLPEVTKFCVIGGIGTVMDLGGAAILHGRYHFEPLAAKAVSVSIATVFTYLGSRFWTFRHRDNQAVHREALLFFLLNLVGLLIAEAVIGTETYVLGQHGSLGYNVASVIGSGLGTIFRFYAYRKWVFLAPSGSASGAPFRSPAPVNGPAVPGYPPWELDRVVVAAEAAASARMVTPVALRAPGRHRRR